MAQDRRFFFFFFFFKKKNFIFMAPFHAPTNQNPTAAYARDLATVQLLDELGYDEA